MIHHKILDPLQFKKKAIEFLGRFTPMHVPLKQIK